VDTISTQSHLRQRNEASHLDHNFFLDTDSRKLVVNVDHLKPYSGEVDESVLAFPNSTFNENGDASTDLNISDEEEYLLGEIETPEGHRVEEIIKDSINVTPSILKTYLLLPKCNGKFLFLLNISLSQYYYR
jgi:hypothetical protein